MSEAKEVIIVSSDEVAGRRITSVLGLVRGNCPGPQPGPSGGPGPSSAAGSASTGASRGEPRGSASPRGTRFGADGVVRPDSAPRDERCRPRLRQVTLE